MILPSTLKNNTEWTFVGPMGPAVPASLESFPVLCIDGGAHYTSRKDIWVGDGDSLKEDVLIPHLFRHPPEKDKSDLALALDLFIEPLHYKFHFWGLMGGRRDHELFNLGEALSFLNHHPECQILFYGEDSRIYFHLLGNGNWKFSHSGTFSLGCLKACTVSLQGDCRYPISRPTSLRPLNSFGLSNEGFGEMTLESSGAVFIYYPEGIL